VSIEIEWLKFRVVPSERERFVQQDDAIWTRALAQYPGYLGKEVWINPNDETEVITIIRWQSFEQWQAIPTPVLDATEAEFSQAMGGTYELIDSRHYQVRRFARD
jgi:uncharacterized protein (TIGR03792 family)